MIKICNTRKTTQIDNGFAFAKIARMCLLRSVQVILFPVNHIDVCVFNQIFDGVKSDFCIFEVLAIC